MFKMASAASTDDSQEMKRIHVPSCDSQQCEQHMKDIVTALEERSVTCVCESRGDYSLGGLYHKRFSRYYLECSCTIIHVCPGILRKIQLPAVKELLTNNDEKSIFVRLPNSPSEVDDFLGQFHITDLCSPEKQQKFIRDLTNETVENQRVNQPSQPLTPTEQPPEASDPEIDPYAGAVSAVFDMLTPVLRGPDVSKPYVEKIHLGFSHTSELKGMLDNFEKLGQMQLKDLKNITYLCHVTVPELQKKKDIVSLARLAHNHNPRLRLQALHTLCHVLLDSGLNGFPYAMLKEAEDALYAVLEQNSNKSLNSDDLGCTDLLVILYTMINVMCVMNCDHSDIKCNISVVYKHTLFHMKKTMSLPAALNRFAKGSSKSPKAHTPRWRRVLSMCFTHWKQKTCAALSRTASSILADREDGAMSELRKQPELQLFTLMASLLKFYNDEDPFNFVSVLCMLVKLCDPKTNDIGKVFHRIMISAAVCGITLFLQHKTAELTTMEKFDELCRKAVEQLNLLLKKLREGRQHCLYRMTSLLFHSSKAVRQHTAILFREQNFYHEPLWNLLVYEIDSFLWPLLTFTSKSLKSKTQSGETHHTWTVLQSSFNNHSVLTHIRRPTGTDHIRQNSRRDRVVQPDRYFCELSCLKRLRHASLVQLMAYHDHCCPQFYITEDYETKVLQTILVNKSKNGDCFPVQRLLEMLVEALEGIQFCHEQGYVHRDLTAASFFISGTGRVKLANFKQMRKLADKGYVREFDSSSIPTRWSAPESLRLCLFSIASEKWMVGHLMYEVLTHGRMPYSDVAKRDEELMPMVVKGEQTLCYEPCILPSLSSIIQQLAVIKEEDRSVSVAEVISQLQKEIENMNAEEDNHLYFPSLTGPRQAASGLRRGLVLSLVGDYKSPKKGASGDSEVDESGYTNIGPQRGLQHFLEPCPDGFTSDLWSVLTQEKLPGVPPIIGHPQKNANGQQELPFAIPAETLCSLKDAVLTRWLGDDIAPYVSCLRQLAAVMAHLHSHRIILCDFAADTVHIEKFPSNPPKFKVWLSSLPSMKLLPTSALKDCIQLDRPHIPEKRRRAAGEVLQYGQYSTASDVYCYSILAWWVFNAFDSKQNTQAQSLSPLDDIPESEVYENIAVAFNRPLLSKPKCCPEHIYTRLKECWQSQRHARPTMQRLDSYMTLQEPSSQVTLEDIYNQSGPLYFEIDNESRSSDQGSDMSDAGSYTYADFSDHSLYSENDVYDTHARLIPMGVSLEQSTGSEEDEFEGEDSGYMHLPPPHSSASDSEIYEETEKLYDDFLELHEAPPDKIPPQLIENAVKFGSSQGGYGNVKSYVPPLRHPLPPPPSRPLPPIPTEDSLQTDDAETDNTDEEIYEKASGYVSGSATAESSSRSRDITCSGNTAFGALRESNTDSVNKESREVGMGDNAKKASSPGMGDQAKKHKPQIAPKPNNVSPSKVQAGAVENKATEDLQSPVTDKQSPKTDKESSKTDEQMNYADSSIQTSMLKEGASTSGIALAPPRPPRTVTSPPPPPPPSRTLGMKSTPTGIASQSGAKPVSSPPAPPPGGGGDDASFDPPPLPLPSSTTGMSVRERLALLKARGIKTDGSKAVPPPDACTGMRVQERLAAWSEVPPPRPPKLDKKQEQKSQSAAGQAAAGDGSTSQTTSRGCGPLTSPRRPPPPPPSQQPNRSSETDPDEHIYEDL